MPHRMDVEMTSDRGDGSWTWRAAGARQPKGVVDGSLLPEGARVGDVLRVEAEMGIDGINIVAVLPSKERKRPEPRRLEVVGGPEPRPSAPQAGRPARPGQDPSPDHPREGRDGTRRSPSSSRPRSPALKAAASKSAARRPRERPRRLSPAHVHRSAALADLPPEQRAIAEQVLKGGIPAVRQAVQAQNAQLRAQGQPEVKADPLVAMAEQLLPRLRAAEWRDRADAAAQALDDVPLRDLRLVVAGADVAARDSETRQLASILRQALERRLNEQRQAWLDEMTNALDDGKLVRALRLSSRPPDPGARFPAEMAVRLSEAAGQAMAGDTSPERWATVLEAVAESPVRRSVKPAGLPEGADEQVLNAARQASGRVPALAPLLGIDMPPPPGPPRRRPPGARPAPRSTGLRR